jgi:hypothetical protein
MAELSPDYLNIDFATLKTRIQTQLAVNDTFADYDYEGSNIAVLIELVAYLGDLTTFFANKIAKNIYIDTADIYENVHRLATLIGYDPKGYRAAQTDVTVTVSGGVSEGDTLTIAAWTKIASDQTDSDGNTINFYTVTDQTISAGSLPHSFDVHVRQGDVITLGPYDGDDIVDNELILPTGNYAYDDDLDDANVPIEVQVDGEIWTRVSDFYDEISGLTTINEVYKFEYDKYTRHKVKFSSSRTVPTRDNTIYVTVLETLGTNGSVGAGTITVPETNFIFNVDSGVYLDNDVDEVVVTNAAATTSSSEPETVDNIRDSAKGALHAQYRNVTAQDYRTSLESRSDVDVAQAWGEKEVAPSGDYSEYNKVHLTVIPNVWGTGTINTSASPEGYVVPISYAASYQTTLEDYLEPRKMLTVYEEWELPRLVYFDFDIGIRVKRLYAYADVYTDVYNKLIYYFDNSLRDFNETINFMDIHEFILDTTQQSSTDTFSNVAGIRNLNIRDIDCLNYTVQAYGSTTYPRYEEAAWTGDNTLRPIELGYDQFPAVNISTCTFTEEN